MKSIEVKYFALFREKAGTESESLQTEANTYLELYAYLLKRHHLELPAEMVQVAVNDEFTSMHGTLMDGAKVVFIPPVAGG